MKAFLILNGFDVSPWLKEEGLEQYEIVRKSREVVTLNGIMNRGEITKRGITAKFVDMRDKTWYAVKAAIRTRPVRVRYLDDDLGEREADFWVTDPRSVAKVVRGGTTTFSGGSLTLEEV